MFADCCTSKARLFAKISFNYDVLSCSKVITMEIAFEKKSTTSNRQLEVINLRALYNSHKLSGRNVDALYARRPVVWALYCTRARREIYVA